jgi:hypothetical protein
MWHCHDSLPVEVGPTPDDGNRRQLLGCCHRPSDRCLPRHVVAIYATCCLADSAVIVRWSFLAIFF